MGGKVLVTLPDPDGANAHWHLTGDAPPEDQLTWACWAAPDPAGGITETTVLEIGSALGTLPIEMAYAPADESGESDFDVLDTFTASLRIIDGPGAARPTMLIETQPVTVDDDGRTLQVPRNGAVRINLLGQHELGHDWVLVRAGEALRAFCPTQAFPEGPGPKDMWWINVFTFTAMTPGAVGVLLEYRDLDAPGAPPLDTFEVTIEVE